MATYTDTTGALGSQYWALPVVLGDETGITLGGTIITTTHKSRKSEWINGKLVSRVSKDEINTLSNSDVFIGNKDYADRVWCPMEEALRTREHIYARVKIGFLTASYDGQSLDYEIAHRKLVITSLGLWFGKQHGYYIDDKIPKELQKYLPKDFWQRQTYYQDLLTNTEQ